MRPSCSATAIGVAGTLADFTAENADVRQPAVGLLPQRGKRLAISAPSDEAALKLPQHRDAVLLAGFASNRIDALPGRRIGPLAWPFVQRDAPMVAVDLFEQVSNGMHDSLLRPSQLNRSNRRSVKCL